MMWDAVMFEMMLEPWRLTVYDSINHVAAARNAWVRESARLDLCKVLISSTTTGKELDMKRKTRSRRR